MEFTSWEEVFEAFSEAEKSEIRAQVGKYWGEYYAFSSKAARDAWVDENYLSRDKASVVARKCTRAEVVSQLGKNFTLQAGCDARDYSETAPELLCSRD